MKPAMKAVNIREAKTHLARLIQKAANGESFVITRYGKPFVKVTAFDAPTTRRRLGFMAGEITVPTDFDRMGQSQIEELYSA